MKNKEIREFAKLKGVCLWQIADRLGTSDNSFSRKLRHEFTPDFKMKILLIIDAINSEKQ